MPQNVALSKAELTPVSSVASELRGLVTGNVLSKVQAEQCRRSLARFVQEGWHVLEPSVKLEWSWHHDAICIHVQTLLFEWLKARDYLRTVGDDVDDAVVAEHLKVIQRCKDMLINVPPGTLKSRIVSVFAIPWFWLTCPDWSVFCLSSNPTVTNRDSRYCLELTKSEWYRESFDIQWVIVRDAVEEWKTSAGGMRQCKGLNAKVTGLRADAIFIDDPHDAEEAMTSEPKRIQPINRYKEALKNRVNDSRIAVRMCIMQRVHQDDFSQMVLDEGWEHLCIEMEYEPDHKYRRTTIYGWTDPRRVRGESIQPRRFTPAVLADEKKSGELRFATQYQQIPAPTEGAIFKKRWWRWFRYEDQKRNPGQHMRPTDCAQGPARIIRDKNAFDWITISCDADFKKFAGTSRVGLLVIGHIGPDFFVIDNRTDDYTYGETKKAILELRAEYPKAYKILVEEKANGAAIISELSQKVSGVCATNPEGSKEARANAMQPAVKAGNYYILEGAEWVSGGEIDMLGELSVFPNGTRDDQVDALSQEYIDALESPAGVNFLTLSRL